jgi:hypothetical protein
VHRRGGPMTTIDQFRAGSSVLDEPTPIGLDGGPPDHHEPGSDRPVRHRLRPALISGAIYLVHHDLRLR